jgi:hypothetical protein
MAGSLEQFSVLMFSNFFAPLLNYAGHDSPPLLKEKECLRIAIQKELSIHIIEFLIEKYDVAAAREQETDASNFNIDSMKGG